MSAMCVKTYLCVCTFLHYSLALTLQVIFVLDDFERFAKQRGKQTLLYNLLDELQHSHVQVCDS